MKDEFGDRMKMYEKHATQRFMPLLPVCARLDGKCFSKFTQGFERPYDARMSAAMSRLTNQLVKETNACMGYTQSDEITLIWYSPDIKKQIYFAGKIQKMLSVLAATASVMFQDIIADRLPEKVGSNAIFDCRVWQVPSLTEAANVFLWREKDATKNSISMAASHYYSHRELEGKKGKEKQEMLFQKGVNWNDYPQFFKRGVFFQRKVTERKFTTDEIEKLPPGHEARFNDDLTVERTDVSSVSMPPFSSVINRVDVIFNEAMPKTNTK